MSDGSAASTTVNPEEVSESDETSADEEPEVIQRSPRKSRSRSTTLLSVAAVAMVGFVAGIQVQKHASTGTAVKSSTAGQAAGAAEHSRLVDGRARPGANGKVRFIDGSTIYVTQSSGTTVEIRTSGRSRFSKPAPGSLRDVTPGDRIVVRGSRGSDGAVRARSVTVLSPSASHAPPLREPPSGSP